MKTPAKTFQALLVWQKSHQFILNVYKLTAGFPESEMYGLTSQFRRAAQYQFLQISPKDSRREGKLTRHAFSTSPRHLSRSVGIT